MNKTAKWLAKGEPEFKWLYLKSQVKEYIDPDLASIKAKYILKGNHITPLMLKSNTDFNDYLKSIGHDNWQGQAIIRFTDLYPSLTNKADYMTQGKIMAFARSIILDIFEEEVTPCHVWKQNGKITQIMVQQAIL